MEVNVYQKAREIRAQIKDVVATLDAIDDVAFKFNGHTELRALVHYLKSDVAFAAQLKELLNKAKERLEKEFREL